jgi:hypothetical protein
MAAFARPSKARATASWPADAEKGRHGRGDDDPAAAQDEHAPPAVGVRQQPPSSMKRAEEELAQGHDELHGCRRGLELRARVAKRQREARRRSPRWTSPPGRRRRRRSSGGVPAFHVELRRVLRSQAFLSGRGLAAFPDESEDRRAAADSTEAVGHALALEARQRLGVNFGEA